ncbi:MAG: LytTR family transcriptional regulator [Blastocatellia bacterium]|nr:LytTR family transcriptional regulator [Blastocatellia bacterium]
MSKRGSPERRLSYRLKDIEARLDPARFMRLGRGALVNLEMHRRVSAMPGRNLHLPR